MGLPRPDETECGMLAPRDASELLEPDRARTETPGPLGQTQQLVIVRLMVL